jgi:hypothetical protein
MTLQRSDNMALLRPPEVANRWRARAKGLALLLLVTLLFLLAPAMQGIGLSADSAGQHTTGPAAAVDRAAREAAERLAARS